MAGLVSFGICAVCGARVSKSAVRAHVQKCLAGTGSGPRGQVLLVRAQPSYAPSYWLSIAVGPAARLQALDDLLRRVWLECCGHLSEFFAGDREPVGMNRRITDVLGTRGSRLGYVYDFGSSTELVISHTAVIEAAPVKGVRVMVRNEAPSWPCDACGQPATVICMECAGPDGVFYCETHARTHKCDSDAMLPVVNSPRMGVCAYTGED